MQKHQQVLEDLLKEGGNIEQINDADLISVVFGGSSKKSKQIRSIISEYGGLGVLQADIAQLMQHEIDAMSALRLQATLEFTRRLMRPQQAVKLIGPQAVALFVAADLRFLDHEETRVLVLNKHYHLLANVLLYRGTAFNVITNRAEILRPAVARKAPFIVLCHNHPSGDPTPSPEDLDTTKDLAEAGHVLGIELLDHIIIGNPGYTSLQELIDW